MQFWYDQDTEFVQRLVEFFHLGEYWYGYLAALIIVIAATEALTRSKRSSKKVTKMKKSSNFWPAAGLVAIVFLIIVGTLQIAGIGLIDKVKAPKLPSAVTQTVEEAEARLQQHSVSPQGEKKSAPAQQRKSHSEEHETEADEIQVPVWHDAIAAILALLAGGMFWRKRLWTVGTFSVGGVILLNSLFRDNFAGASWQLSDFFKVVFVVLVIVWAYWRLSQAQKDGQWLATIDPKTRQVNNSYKVLLFEKQQILFVSFHLMLILGIVFCDTMFRTNLWLTAIVGVLWALLHLIAIPRVVDDERLRFFAQIALGGMMLLIMLSFWGILLLLPMAGLYLLSTYVKLGPAQKIIWSWMGQDVYDPKYYFWKREDGEDTIYRGELLVIGDYKSCFRKGTHTNLLFSVWLPSNFLEAYFFPEEVLEIDSFVCDPFSTVSVPYPESDKLDQYDAEDLPDKLEFEPEVTVPVNVSVWKYMHVGLYLPMADEDRRDEIGFVKRKIILPAVARFLGRMTMTQATILKLLRSKAKFLMDGEKLTFAEYLGRELRKYGWDLRGVEVGDCNPPKDILEAAQAVKKAEQLIKKIENEAKQAAALAKGEGFKLLNMLQPLADALRVDPMLSVVMEYNKTLQLYGGSNKIITMVPQGGSTGQQDAQSFLQSLMAAMAATGGSPPAPPSTPPAPPTTS